MPAYRHDVSHNKTSDHGIQINSCRCRRFPLLNQRCVVVLLFCVAASARRARIVTVSSASVHGSVVAGGLAVNVLIRRSLVAAQSWCCNCLSPKLTAKCVYVSKEHIFQQASKCLSLKIHEIRVCLVGNDDLLGSVCIDVPAHGQNPMLYEKKIFGDYKQAKLATLIYLQKIGILFVDDVNLNEVAKSADELAKCQRRLLAATSWATLFQDRIQALEAELAAAQAENKRLADLSKAVDVKPNTLSTPPPSGHQVQIGPLQPKSHDVFHTLRVKKMLFKPCSGDSSAAQKIKQEK